MTTERPDRGARALAERERAIRKALRQKDPDSCLWMDGPDEHAAAILANGAVFLPAAEMERLRRIEAAARALKSKPEQAVTDANALAALRAALEPEGSAQG